MGTHPCVLHNTSVAQYQTNQITELDTLKQQELINKINELEALHYREVLQIRQQYESQLLSLETRIESTQTEYEQ